MVAPGRFETQAISADVVGAAPPSALTLKLGLAPVAANGRQIELPRLDVAFTAKEADLSAQGTLATSLTVDLDTRHAQVQDLAGEVTVTGKHIPGATGGSSARPGSRVARR